MQEAYGILEELRRKLALEKNMFEVKLQTCHSTIAKLQDQLKENFKKSEASHLSQQENKVLQQQLRVLEKERDTAMQQVSNYKRQAEELKRELEQQRKRV